jgi:hypothetical protein
MRALRGRLALASAAWEQGSEQGRGWNGQYSAARGGMARCVPMARALVDRAGKHGSLERKQAQARAPHGNSSGGLQPRRAHK